MYGEGLGQALGCALVIVIIITASIFGFGGYFIFSNDKLESRKPIIPTIKLEVNNNKVDTIYVYQIK